MEKLCVGCAQARPLQDFSSRQNKCKGCIRKINRETYLGGKSATRSYDGVYAANLLRTFGLTLEDYAELLSQQGGVCAICAEPETVLRRSGEPYRLAVDHDHRTMLVRGLLCRRCNQIVWAIEEHAGLLEEVAAYLRRFASFGAT